MRPDAFDGDGRTDLPGDPAAVVAAAQRDGTLPSGRFELDPTPPEEWRLRFRVVPDGEPGEALVGDLERHGSGWRLAGYAHCR